MDRRPAPAPPTPKRRKIITSNFDPQHDNLRETVTNNSTGSTTKDWKPDTSPAVLSSKASEAAYKGWRNRRSNTPAAAPQQPVRPPPFFAAPAIQTAGPMYVAMPPVFGALDLARGTRPPVVGDQQDQKLQEDTRQALKMHFKAYEPKAQRLEDAKRMLQSDKESETAERSGESTVSEPETKKDSLENSTEPAKDERNQEMSKQDSDS